MEQNENNKIETSHEEMQKKLKKQRIRQIIASLIGVAILAFGLWKIVCLFLDYNAHETSNDAQIEQYISPVNLRASGYIAKVCFNIDIKSIMFKYDPHALRKTIDDVSIHIPQGKVTAIVGASGSGKTTLIRLMLGYYPVLEGKINIGNTDINKLNKKWWRRQCGVVMQDGVIFSESIARNIAVDDGDIDMTNIRRQPLP